MQILPREPYRRRPFRFLELLTLPGWRLKVYGITFDGDRPDPLLVLAAKEKASEELMRRPLADRTYGVGYLGIHDGRGADFVFLDRWGNENELFHAVWIAPKHEPKRFRPAGPDDACACVWDLHLQYFERNAWVECVLANANRPDLEAYLARRLDGEA